MEQVRFSKVDYEHRLTDLSDRVPEFVGACLAGVEADKVRDRWARVVHDFVRGAFQALECQSGEGYHTWERDRIKDELIRGFGVYDVGNACGKTGAEQDGFDTFMDWLSSPDNFQTTRLRDRLMRRAG
jgi:hypothetical protein